MNTRINESKLSRTLFVDFELYADNDPDFKRELIDHMVDNLQELLQAYRTSIDQNDTTPFQKVCHKVKTTLVILEDDELNALVEDLKNMSVEGARISLLNKICAEIIASLLSEKNRPS